MRYSLFVLALLLSPVLYAQDRLQVLDEETGRPIAGVMARLVYESNEELIISDEEGLITLNEKKPEQLVLQHMGYDILHLLGLDKIPSQLLLKPKATQLDEVVVTGQFEAQSIKNSVYQVRTINEDRFIAQGANSIQDVLSNELNMRFSRDNATGRAGLNFQGLSGQYVKILLDGVQITGRAGTANDIDLNQININAIERIEIVEGPLAVNYGADALAGVVNIITKKGNGQKLNIDLAIQEETVGQEYNWQGDGIQNHSLQLGYQIAPKLFAQGELRRNHFGGWTGDGEGRDKSWYPKTQLFTGGLLRYKGDNHEVYYRLDYLDENIQNLGRPVVGNGLRDPFAIDEHFLTQRWMHQLQGEFAMGEALLNTVFSYTDFRRNTHQFTTNLLTENTQTTNDAEQDTIRHQAYFFRGTLANAVRASIGSAEFTTQIGLEANREIAAGTNLTDGDKAINDLATFVSGELSIDRLKIRPGVRFIYNSVFKTIPTPSVNLKYNWSDRLQLRLGYGRGFRAPSTRELYHEFIDANHNILGNENLKPETSHNFNGDLTWSAKKLPLTVTVNGFFNEVTNRITFFIPEQANQPTSYTNLLDFRSVGTNLRTSYQKGPLTVNAGFSYIGLFQQLNAEAEANQPGYVFSPEWNTQLSYLWKAPAITFSAFYKHTGRAKRYQLITNEQGEEVPELQWIEAFNWLDMTVSKQWESLNVSLGVRNLADITSVNNNIRGGGAHGGGGGATAIAYGRSYFLRINYQFNK